MKKVLTVAAAFLLLNLAGPPAQARTLDEILPLLLAKHERIKTVEAQVETAQFGVTQASAGWLPTLDVAAEAGTEHIKKAAPGEDGKGRWRNTQSARASQLLYDFGETGGNVDLAEANLSTAEANLLLTRQSLILEGTRAYLNALRAYEKLSYARRSEERIKQQTGMEEALVERGAGLSSDVLQAKQQLAGAMALRVLVQGELVNAANRYKALFDEFVSEEDISEFVHPSVPLGRLPRTLDEAVNVALKDNPRLIAARRDLDASSARVDSAFSRFYPRFNAFGEIARKEEDAGQDGVREEYGVGVGVSWNLFNGGADYAAWRAAKADVHRARFALRDLDRSVEEQVRVAWENLNTFRANSDFLNNQANILGEFLDLAKKERKMGTRSLLDVLNAEVTYINAISAAVSADIDTMLAAYDLLASMGHLELDAFRP